MKRRSLFCAILTLAFTILFASKTPAQDFNFTSINDNIEDIEKQGVFTGASLAADFDGEGVNNDTALIDQKRGIVFVLIYDQKTASPRFLVPININDLTGEQLLPTSATAFIDPQTGLQNIAITAAQPSNGTGVGKLIIGINDGSNLFNDINLFRVFDATSSPTDINHGDFNNDGADDLVYIDFRNNNAAVLLNDGGNRFLQPNVMGTGGFEPVSAVVSDFNDDDYLDLAVLNRINGVGTFSPIRLLFGDGSGNLSLSSEVYRAPFNAVSLAGGLMDYSAEPIAADGKPARRMMDLNRDGYPDLAALSATADKFSFPSITLLINRSDSPGQFSANPPTLLAGFDDKGSALLIAGEQGGAALVSGKGVDSGRVGVGGAYHALGVGDFNEDGSPDFVISSAILPPTGTPGANVNFRGAVYLFGNSAASTARISRPLSFGYIKTAPSTTDFNQLDPAEGHDTFVAAIPGAFMLGENAAPGVLHVSLNGNLWLDSNRTSILDRPPFVEIKRSDLNALLGGGRKYTITAGETAVIPASANFVKGPPSIFLIVPTPSGEQPPSFVTIKQKSPNGAIPVVADVIVDSADVNRGPGDKLFRIAVQAFSINTGSGPRLPLVDDAFFTLVVKPNAPPVIAPIPNQTLLPGKMTAVQLNISDPDNQRVTVTVKCDKGDFARIDPATNILSFAPKPEDVGGTTCTVRAVDQFNLSSQQSLAVNVAASSPAISSAVFGDKTLVLDGIGFSASAVKATVNGLDVSSTIANKTDTQIVLKGNKKKLNLKKGSNRIMVKVNGAASNTFVLKL